jgi:hypothetical protein
MRIPLSRLLWLDSSQTTYVRSLELQNASILASGVASA